MKLLHALSTKVQKLVTTVLLGIAYVIGIGIVSVFGKLFGTQFMTPSSRHTSWTPFRRSEHDRSMY